MTRRTLVMVGAGLAAAVSVLLPAHPAAAHPLGNFSVNVYSGLRAEPGVLAVDYVVDLAEIPTVREERAVDVDRDGDVSRGEAQRYGTARCSALARGLDVEAEGRPVAGVVGDSSVALLPGAAGLMTLRLECAVRFALGSAGGEHRVTYRDRNFGDRVGWRELTAVSDGVTLTGNELSGTSISKRLTDYPDDRLRSPLDQRDARFEVQPGGPRLKAANPEGRLTTPEGIAGTGGAGRVLASIVGDRDLTLGLGLIGLGVAMLLGALHAIAPGHGKTVMAAYVVGQRGGLRHAIAIGVTVASTHTIGVLVLGLFLTAGQVLAPERLYPWLGAASGVLVALIGLGLLRGALARRRHARAHRLAHDHAHHQHDGHGHDHGHQHGHHGHHHHHGHAAHLDRSGLGDQGLPSWRSLVALGVAGGMVPSPSALVVLLGAMALGRAWFGVIVVLAYGIGMSITLVAAGLVLVHARKRLEGRLSFDPARLSGRVLGALPAITAALLVAAGVAMAARSVTGA